MSILTLMGIGTGTTGGVVSSSHILAETSDILATEGSDELITES